MPPVLIMLITTVIPNDPISNAIRRATEYLIAPSYLFSLLHSLVARSSVRAHLDARLASEGIEVGRSGGSSGGVFVSNPRVGKSFWSSEEKLVGARGRRGAGDEGIKVEMESVKVCGDLAKWG